MINHSNKRPRVQRKTPGHPKKRSPIEDATMCTPNLDSQEILRLVSLWHENQTWHDRPYIDFVQELASKFPTNSDEYKLALLHGCMKYQDVTREMLELLDIKPSIIEAIEALSCDPLLGHSKCMEQIKGTPMAFRVYEQITLINRKEFTV